MISRADDQQAREVAQQQFDVPLVLEAGAGTGKTAVLVARNVSSILYVRNRIRLERGKPYDSAIVWIVHTATLLAIVGLAGFGHLG